MTIPVRKNGETIEADWFNILKTEIEKLDMRSTLITESFVVTTDYNIIYTASNAQDIIVTLPDPVLNQDRRFTIKKIFGSFKTSIKSIDNRLIDDAQEYVLNNSYDSVTVNSNGTQWYIDMDYKKVPQQGKQLDATAPVETIVDELFVYIDPTANDVDVKLPVAADYEGRLVLVSALNIINEAKISPESGDTIGLTSSYIFEDANAPILLNPKGSNWLIVQGGGGGSQEKIDVIAGTRLLNGSSISVASGTEVAIATGEYVFVDETDPVDHFGERKVIAGQTVTISDLTRTITYLTINTNGTVNQYAKIPAEENFRDEVFLGSVLSFGGVVFSVQDYYLGPEDNLGNALEDYARTLGPITVEGNAITAGTGLELNKGVGKTLRLGTNLKIDHTNPNIRAIPAQTPAMMVADYRNPSDPSGWIDPAPMSGVLVPNLWDDGSGILQAVGNNNYTIQPLFLAGDVVIFQYGQEVFNTFDEAKAAIGGPYDLDPRNSKRENAELLGYIIIRSNDTVWDEVVNFFPAASAGGGGSGVTDHELLTNLLGGAIGEHYHLTNAELASLADINLHENDTDLQGGTTGEHNHATNAEYSDIQGTRQTITAATDTITETTVIIDSSSNAVLATLPDAATFWAKTITIWASDLTNTVEIEDASSNIIHTIRTVDSPIQLVTDGTNWIVTDWKGKATRIFDNDYNLKVSSTGTIEYEDISAVDTITFAGGEYTATFKAGLGLTVPPRVIVIPNAAGGEWTARVFSITTTGFKYAIYNGASATASTCEIDIRKMSPDYKEPELGTLVKTKRMTYGARIANNGTASIISQTTPDNPAIASVSRISVGRIAVTYTPGFFKEIPSVESTAVNVDINAGILAGSETINGVTIETRDPASTALDFPVNLLIERQGSDSTDEPIGFVPEKTIIVGQEGISGKIDLGTGLQNTYKYVHRVTSTVTTAQTLVTIDTGLVILNGNKFTASLYMVHGNEYNTTGTAANYISYNSATGAIYYQRETLDLFADTFVTVEYYKPSETP
jgi:hypothetical protein